jgi:hypothetical protein
MHKLNHLIILKANYKNNLIILKEKYKNSLIILKDVLSLHR